MEKRQPKGLDFIREPKNIDFSNKSEPGTEEELADFRKIMKAIKEKNAKLKKETLRSTLKKNQPV